MPDGAAGAISADVAGEWAFKQGMAEEVVTALKAYWSQTAGPAATPWANRAASRLFTVTHNEFLADHIDEALARVNLDLIGVLAAEQNTILAYWDAERTTSRLALTQAQIVKAYKKAEYTHDQAISLLEEKGMTPADAETRLAIA